MRTKYFLFTLLIILTFIITGCNNIEVTKKKNGTVILEKGGKTVQVQTLPDQSIKITETDTNGHKEIITSNAEFTSSGLIKAETKIDDHEEQVQYFRIKTKNQNMIELKELTNSKN